MRSVHFALSINVDFIPSFPYFSVSEPVGGYFSQSTVEFWAIEQKYIVIEYHSWQTLTDIKN